MTGTGRDGIGDIAVGHIDDLTDRNLEGQVGDGTTTKRTTPVQIGAMTEWETVDAGGNHTLALLDS